MLNSSSNIKLSVDFLFLRFLQHFFYIKDYFFEVFDLFILKCKI